MEQFIHECAGLADAQQNPESGAPGWRNGHFRYANSFGRTERRRRLRAIIRP